MNSVSANDIKAAKQRLGIVGFAPALLEAVGRALRVAPIDLSVLIVGESGTGKEFFPKIIHNAGARKHSKYIAVNCGAIPEGTIDSELFGHEKGAFTGAIASRKGYFEEANGGTIFLDEVAELPLTTQARLLRVLETGEFLKVGSSQVQKTNIRVVAATNVDMARAVAEGRFRQDLYYRLSTVQINVPPLRDRGDDIGLLARKFAADFAERYSTPQLQLTPDAMSLLRSYAWPGNVRELKNVVEQMSLFEAEPVTRERLQHYLPVSGATSLATVPHQSQSGPSNEILLQMIFRLREEVDSLRQQLEEQRQPAPEHKFPAVLPRFSEYSEISESSESSQPSEPSPPSPETLEETERDTIPRSLERNGGRRKATATELNISERTLYRKIKEYGLE